MSGVIYGPSNAAVIESVGATLSGMVGATATAAALIPAGSLVIGVSYRVTVLITGPATFEVGTVLDPSAFGTAVPVALNTIGTISRVVQLSPVYYPDATDVVVTANAAGFTAGTLKVMVYYIQIVAPT